MLNKLDYRLDYRCSRYQSDSSEHFFQWWYFDASLEDGSHLFFMLFPRLNARIEGHANGRDPMLFLTFMDSNGERTSIRKIIDEQPVFSRDGRRIEFGDNCLSWTRDGVFRFRFTDDEFSCDLTYRPNVPPWAPFPGARGYLFKPFLWMADRRLDPRSYFQYISVLPRSSVQGIAGPTGHESQVSGTGYHEQGKSNVPLQSVFRYWYWMRAFNDEWTIILPVAGALEKNFGKRIAAANILYNGNQLCRTFDASGVFVSFEVLDWFHPRPNAPAVPSRIRYLVRKRGLSLELDLSVDKKLESFSGKPFYAVGSEDAFWCQYLSSLEISGSYNKGAIGGELNAVLEVMDTGSI